MTLREYLKSLNKLVKENPEALDMDVITSSDDEGDNYNEVYYSPSIGDKELYGFFIDKEEKVVCLN